ncbi:aminotransferase class I/II-fold pyridoxal phosphate-dependent enzyme [Bacillaceae bacterium W0354]
MNEEIFTIINEVEEQLQTRFKEVSKTVTHNQAKVLEAFQKHQVGDYHFNPTTGYGYDDSGRDKLEELYASIFNTEDALVRHQIVSGTHAITTVLFGLLRPGDELMYITGRPYDTLEQVIGINEQVDGSLKDYGIKYNEIALKNDGKVDFDQVKQSINKDTKVIAIQRSKGYAQRPSFMIHEIKEMVEFVKNINSNLIVFVDNCYGEFVEELEPTDVGADIMAGSLIKNPGAGIVKTGGYIVGKKDFVNKSANYLVAPGGLGKETGASIYSLLEMFQGLFLAPHIVGEALKGAYYTSQLLQLHGYETTPGPNENRTDLIQSITFPTKEEMITFAQIVQQQSPINSHVTPYPSYMPGYEHDVIMAAGTFIQGGSLELTADGPIKEPYTLYVQGGLTYEHVKIAITKGLLSIKNRKVTMT